MAIISCPECGGKVSTNAAACPHCGTPVEASKIAASSNSLAERLEREEATVAPLTTLPEPEQSADFRAVQKAESLIPIFVAPAVSNSLVPRRTGKGTLSKARGSYNANGNNSTVLCVICVVIFALVGAFACYPVGAIYSLLEPTKAQQVAMGRYLIVGSQFKALFFHFILNRTAIQCASVGALAAAVPGIACAIAGANDLDVIPTLCEFVMIALIFAGAILCGAYFGFAIVFAFWSPKWAMLGAIVGAGIGGKTAANFC